MIFAIKNTHKVEKDPEKRKLLEQNNFQILNTIGQGGFGVVYQAHRLEVGVVAAKVVNNDDFQAGEWDTAGILNNDPDQSVQNLVEQRKKLPIPIVRTIMLQILNGIQYIHSKGIIHKDIKPSNILMHSPPGCGRVILKMTDFGEAVIKQDNLNPPYVNVAGTDVYMPPEEIFAFDTGQFFADEKV
ncbi:MAG: hypothetical protein EZS28_041449 [Streblomastix strix]|uniref:Protein kinase domain-containing protein n=1 Tax=Streblomastix strix TaxID=222440 RepID=A0A5J4TXI2_9EUKA|nr:MAG: hypothetical protein EZS28_041449 [Streblomastix strix]